MALAMLPLIPCAILRLGYAEDKKPQQAAEKQPLQGTDDSKARPELAVAEAKYKAALAKAEDDVNVRYAMAVAEVAKAEYQREKKAFDSGLPAVSYETLSEMSLKCKECDLAVEKAKLEQRIAGEEAKIAKAELEKAKAPKDRKLQWGPRS